jgi:hypothetical protein
MFSVDISTFITGVNQKLNPSDWFTCLLLRSEVEASLKPLKRLRL